MTNSFVKVLAADNNLSADTRQYLATEFDWTPKQSPLLKHKATDELFVFFCNGAIAVAPASTPLDKLYSECVVLNGRDKPELPTD